MDKTNENSDREKGQWFFLLTLVCIGLAFIVVALSQRALGSGVVIADSTPEPISVVTATVNYSNILTISETFTGIAQAKRQSQLGFETGGRIAKILVDIGDYVVKGQLLAERDQRALLAQLNAAKASAENIKVATSLARSTLNRYKLLHKKGHLSKQNYDEAKANLDVQIAALKGAEAQIDLLRVQIDLANLKAPYNGVITQRNMDEGVIAQPGASIVELTETDQIEVHIGIPQNANQRIEIGQTYNLKSHNNTVEAVLRSKTGVIDTNHRTVICVFDIAPSQFITAGATMRLEIEHDLMERGFWVPISALHEANRGLWGLYIVSELNNTVSNMQYAVEPRLVEIIHMIEDQAYIRGAAIENESFVTEGLNRLTPGTLVKPVAATSIVGSPEG